MDEEDKKIDQIESGELNTNDELNQLKKEMIGRVIDKLKEKNQNDAVLQFGKDMVTDYLLDNGEAEDKVNDFFLGVGINLFSDSAEKLKDLREKIKNSNTKEALDTLEKSIIENLDNSGNIQNESQTSSGERISETAAASSVAYASTSHIDSSDIESTVDSAKVGEAKEVPLKQRMKWLFPEGVPTQEKQMKKYLTKIKIPIRTPEGKEKKLTLHIHKKLANEYKAIFQEMYDRGIPVNPSSTGGYNWRKMRKGKKMSHHSYGTAVDVNWDVNGGVYGKTVANSPYYNSQATVDIWKKHGFYWGGDWSKNYNDPMHFTYMNG